MDLLAANGLHVVGGGPRLFVASDLLGRPRADPVGLAIVLIGSVLYLRARARLKGREDVDPRATARWTLHCWCWGMFVVLAATCSGLASDAPTDPSVHLIADTLLFAVAAPLLAAGAPLTVAFAAGSERTRKGIQAAVTSRPVKVLTHPIVCSVLFWALLVGLYFGGLYRPVVDHRSVADLVEVALLVVSWLWCWSTFGPDALPARRTWFHRICTMFLQVPFFMGVGMAVDSQPYPPAPGLSVFRWHVGGDVVWSTGIMFAIGGVAALLYAMVHNEERDARSTDAESDEAAAAQLALWRATRDAIAMEEALARSTVVHERPASDDQG